MAVIRIFSSERPALTLSEVAHLTGMTRATARRILLTLEKLGYVSSNGRLFSLTPQVLTLGWAYLSSLNLWDIALPLMERLVEETEESCSAATLDLPDIVYVARVPTRRIMAISLNIGSRLPAHATSMGRVLLADLSEDELEAFLATATLERFTDRTIVDPDELRAELAQVRSRGWALADGELEVGLRSVAAPIRSHDGRAVAALNTSAAAARATIDDLVTRFRPALLRTAAMISASLQRPPAGPLLEDAGNGAPVRRPRPVRAGRTA
jgi:IclR family pca regulon transcriptional regulator